MFRLMMLAVLFLTVALGPAAAVAQDTPVRGGAILAAISADRPTGALMPCGSGSPASRPPRYL